MYHQSFLDRLEAGLRTMLPVWGAGPEARLTLLTVSENATFLLEEPERAERLVLRVHRPGYHAREEILSELAWTAALREAGAVETPAVVPGRDGALLYAFADGGDQRHVVAFEHMSGVEPATDGTLARWFRRLGAVTARLHLHARGWTRPDWFRRKVWDFDAMLGSRQLWGDWRAAEGLDAPGRALLERTAGALDQALRRYGQGARFGLVHADLRLANLLVDGDRLGVIDFDDCGLSWFGYDFAAAVSFIETDPSIPELMAAWVEGYRGEAPLAAADEAMLPTFVMLRRMLLTAWIASHGETPTAQELGRGYTEGTLALAERWLATA